MDEDKGGEVEFDEFLHWFQQAQQGPREGWAVKLVVAARKYMEVALMGKVDNTFAGGLARRLKVHQSKLTEVKPAVLDLVKGLPQAPEPFQRRPATPEPKYHADFRPRLFGRRSQSISPTKGLSMLNLTGRYGCRTLLVLMFARYTSGR